MIAAPTPWTARAAINASSDQASPHSSDAAVKKTDPGHDHAPASEQVGHPSAEQEQPGEGDGVSR